MSEPLYNVILEPGTLPGFDREQVGDNLARLFNVPPDKSATLLDGGERIIKREQLAGAARKYQAAMTRAGARVRLEPCAVTPAAAGTGESGLALLPQIGNILKDDERPLPPAAPAIDISTLQLAPAGSALLPEEYRRPAVPAVEPPAHWHVVESS